MNSAVVGGASIQQRDSSSNRAGCGASARLPALPCSDHPSRCMPVKSGSTARVGFSVRVMAGAMAAQPRVVRKGCSAVKKGASRLSP